MDRSVPAHQPVYERFAFARELKPNLVAQIQPASTRKVFPADVDAYVAFRLLTMIDGAAMMSFGSTAHGENAGPLARDA